MRENRPNLAGLDHFVLTVADIEVSVGFYETVLGMSAERFFPDDGSERWSLKFGKQKINLHKAGSEFEPKALSPAPGTADLCFLTDTPVADWLLFLNEKNVPVEEGPIKRTGATAPILSIYVRDPDGNLLEISNKVS